MKNQEHHPQQNFQEQSLSLYLSVFQRKLLIKQLQAGLRPEYQRRIEIMLLADAGKSQTQICEMLHCSSETARYWMRMAQMGMAHQWDDRPMGRPKEIDQRYLDRLRELVGMHPKELGFPFKRWTAQWLSKQLFKEFGIQISDRHVNRLLRQMGLSTRSAPQETASDSSTYSNPSIAIKDLQEASPPKSVWSLNLIPSSHQISQEYGQERKQETL